MIPISFSLAFTIIPVEPVYPSHTVPVPPLPVIHLIFHILGVGDGRVIQVISPPLSRLPDRQAVTVC